MPERILKDVFGYAAFRPHQREVIEHLLAGEHVLAVMPTGSGKSMCFQIPALMRGGLCVVVSPLIALMEDQVAALKLAGVAAESINGSRERARNVAVWRRVAAGEIDLLYLAPERLMTERMLDALGRLRVTQFAVDEAHCISKWGPSFRPEYEDLQRLPSLFPGIPIAALTATADQSTREDIRRKLFAGGGRSIVAGFDRPNIRLSIAPRQDRKSQLLQQLADHPGASGIVYCLSRAKTDDMALFLQSHDVQALAYHAGMTAEARTRHQDRFMTEPGVVIVATIAFGMGIDKPDVRFVFHADMPASVEAYYQEIGRAGRDGKPAVAHMLYGLDDLRMRRMFIDQEDAGEDHKRREHKRLDALIAICESPECRRRALLAYFGEESQPCGNCDVCIEPPEMVDGTEDGHAVALTVYNTGQRFGAVHLIDILRGSNNERIRSLGHDRLASYGMGADKSKESWRSIVRQMIAAGFLQLDIAGHGGLALSRRGSELLQGEAAFSYRRETVQPGAGRKRRQSAAPAAAAADLSANDSALLDQLKALRLRLAQERKVPAYVVFPDRSLVDMAQRKPHDLESFASIHGVGAAKLKKFADPFLTLIRQAG